MHKLRTDLAEPENDLFVIESDFYVNLGTKLRQAGQFFKANELFFEVCKWDRKIT